ncbi:MAG TPA: alpha/beta hydrolase [Nocardioidaceae bacterium]|jgi:pimeloyl-ACP methyl ester carboxylesterase|nr:alpha/beta hydrolase [Nocardioidaceae bacterium]
MTTTTAPTTSTTTSADGTTIAFETTGRGPALVLVDGALCSRTMGPSGDLSAQLADRFTVVRYDRRGRGGSGAGSSPYAVGREVEDLLAVLAAVGGHAHVLGISSGAALALEAARGGAPIDRLAVFEAPFILDDTHPANDPLLPERVQELVDRGRRGQAVATFLRTVGAPAPMVLLMRLTPVWRKLTAVAHTLPYDLSIVVPFEQGEPLPDGYYDAVAVPTLVLAGGRSPAYMRSSQAAIADALTGGRLDVLPRQTHMVKAAVLAPVVADFLTSTS